MSQRRFKSGVFEVLTGWDRPCQDHFLVVEHPNNRDTPVYSNLSDPTLPGPSGGMTLEQVVAKLDELAIKYPASLVSDLKRDRRTDAGNVVVRYDEVK